MGNLTTPYLLWGQEARDCPTTPGLLLWPSLIAWGAMPSVSRPLQLNLAINPHLCTCGGNLWPRGDQSQEIHSSPFSTTIPCPEAQSFLVLQKTTWWVALGTQQYPAQYHTVGQALPPFLHIPATCPISASRDWFTLEGSGLWAFAQGLLSGKTKLWQTICKWFEFWPLVPP